MVKAHDKSWENLKPVLLEWDDEDNKLFNICLVAAHKKVEGVAKEYLHGGCLEIVPLALWNIPADNLDLERLFGKWKRVDTHATHLSPLTLEGKIMWKENRIDRVPSIVLGDKSLSLVREKSRLIDTQKKKDQEVALQKQKVWEVQDAHQKVLKENKRKRDHTLEQSLSKLVLVTTKEEVMKLNKEELRLQLYYHKLKNSRPKICVSAPKKGVLQERLIALLQEKK
jgi:hypothetical protein